MEGPDVVSADTVTSFTISARSLYTIIVSIFTNNTLGVLESFKISLRPFQRENEVPDMNIAVDNCWNVPKVEVYEERQI